MKDQKKYRNGAWFLFYEILTLIILAGVIFMLIFLVT